MDINHELNKNSAILESFQHLHPLIHVIILFLNLLEKQLLRLLNIPQPSVNTTQLLINIPSQIRITHFTLLCYSVLLRQ